jgi:hypothetical protein
MGSPPVLVESATMRRVLLPVLLLALCLSASAAKRHAYLFVWAGDDDKKASDFLAVIDADPQSPAYGSVVATMPVGAADTMPHHTEDVVAANGHLLANSFDAGKTWLFDVSHPTKPRMLTSFGELDGYNHPHSYIRLPNGNVLATFQHSGEHRTGGLVEFEERGTVIRTASAADPDDPKALVTPYSVIAMPQVDRAVSTDMSMMDYKTHGGQRVQIWRLSDLRLLHTLAMPPEEGKPNGWTGEPRVLVDGSVYVHTFHCELYHLTGVQGDKPQVSRVYRFEGELCAVPLAIGHWWVQTVPEAHAVVVLDITDPEHPREVSRLTLDDQQAPHWIALESGGRRIVINSGERGEHRVFLANFDSQTGALTLDGKFRDPGSERPGVSMDGKTWPHGFHGNAFPHGAVFSR